MTSDGTAAEGLEPSRHHTEAPGNELPVGLAPFGVLGRSGDAVVTITGVRVSRFGLDMDLGVRLRREPRGLRRRLFGLISPRHQDEAGSAEERLWLGVQYADGRTGSTVGIATRDDLHDAPVRFASGGGRGGTRSYQTHLWLAPLPPAGPLTFVCTWPLFNIPETQTVVDATPIQEAAARTEILWPVEPIEAYEPSEPLTPVSDWFAQAARRPDQEP
jgi:hypothetical protein